MSKVTLNSLKKKYNDYGYTFEKNKSIGLPKVVISFDGEEIWVVQASACVSETSEEMTLCSWLVGQSCPLPTVELDNQELQLFTLLPAAVDPTREAIKAASDADGGVDLSGPLDAFQETPERYTVSFRELARIESEKILAARVDKAEVICLDQVIQHSEPKVMQVSHFDDVRAMNNRVSDADLYDYEMSLQNEIFPDVKPEPQPVPATPVEIMKATDEMSEALVEIAKDGFYFDRLTSYDPWAKVETKKFIVYKNGSNFGKLEFDPTFKTWSFRLCVDGDYVYKPEGGYVSARQVRDAMIHHARVPF